MRPWTRWQVRVTCVRWHVLVTRVNPCPPHRQRDSDPETLHAAAADKYFEGDYAAAEALYIAVGVGTCCRDLP
jgi:hypothetical protein